MDYPVPPVRNVEAVVTDKVGRCTHLEDKYGNRFYAFQFKPAPIVAVRVGDRVEARFMAFRVGRLYGAGWQIISVKKSFAASGAA